MRIAIVAPTSIPARRANTLQVMKMAQAFAQLGNTVQLYAPGGRASVFEKIPVWDDISHHYGLKVRFPIEILPADERFRRYDYGWRAVNQTRRWNADLLYTRLPQAAALGSVFGLETIFELHDFPIGIFGSGLFRLFLRGRGARKLVLITHALKVDLIHRFQALERTSFTMVAPDGVDLARYADLPNPPKARQILIEKYGQSLPVQRFTVGYTGHLYPGRGISLIIEAASRLPENNFLIVGGEDDDVARIRAESVNLNNVFLTGFVPNADVPLFQAASDVLLMPYQGRVAASSGGDIASYLSPMKLFEYLAAGRAIISSDLPVLQEILDPDNSIILPAKDTDAWVMAIRDLQNDPKRRETLAVRAGQLAKNFSWEARAEQILK